jgi:CHASE3 domain sensor protein
MHASSLGQPGLPDQYVRATTTPAKPATVPSHAAGRSLLSVGVRIGAGFAAALLVLALLSTSVNSRLSAAAEEREWVRHSLEVLKLNEQTFRMLLQAESAARGHQLTQAPVFQRQFETAIIDLERSMSELKRLTVDNSQQQQFVGTLTPVVRQRLESMRELFDASNREVQQTVFAGTALMERARQLNQAIHQEESRLLQERTLRARRAEAYTRQLLEYGALLAVVLTAFIGWLVTRSILRPVKALSSGAARIGAGDYSQPVVVGREDELGQLATVFNDMAARIATRELTLSEQDWMNTGLARLSRLMEGAQDSARLGSKLLPELAVLIGARQSLIYVPAHESRDSLQLQASYASNEPPQRIAAGQGLIGQCYRDCTGVVLDDVPDAYLRIGSALGETRPAQIVIMPAIFEGQVKALLELGSLTPFTTPQLTLLRRF